jgi:site-specific recombinase XerC
MIHRLIDPAGIADLSGFTPFKIESALGTIRDGDLSASRVNAYVRAVKGFAKRLTVDGRLSADPLAFLKTSNTDADRRHERRAFSNDELSKLMDAAANAPRRSA